MAISRLLMAAMLASALPGAWASEPVGGAGGQPGAPRAKAELSAGDDEATLADQLNRKLDRLFGRTQTAPGSTSQGAPVPALADQLNRGIDRLFWRKPELVPKPTPPGSTLGDQLNRQLDRLLSLRIGEAVLAVTDEVPGIVSATAQGAAQAARVAALTGPVIRPDPVLPALKLDTTTLSGLTLLQAWRQAKTNDAQLRAARAAKAAGYERVPQARAQLMPSIQASASRFQNQVAREGVNTLSQPLNIFDRYPSESQTLQLRQPILRAQLFSQLEQARYAIHEADANYMREEQAMSVRVALSYFEALLARDQVELVLGQQRFLTVAVDAETKALKAGTGTRTAVDEAQARLDLNRAQELEARQAEAQARRQLQSFLLQPVATLARLRNQPLDVAVLAGGGLEDWTQRALAQSPEIKALQAQIDQARTEVSKARAAHLPTLDLVAQAQRSRSENIITPQSQYESRAIGLQLTVPIYGGGFVNSTTRQAAAQHERVREQLMALQEDLSVRVHREYRGVTEGLARIRGLEVALRSAEVALESARRSQAAGVRTALDVLNAEQQRRQVLRDLAQARYQLLASAVRLHALAGSAEEATIGLVDSLLEP
jgi:outer membrane protein/protease secretion system outer membrane protein